ncbi:FHA domain-containing protein [Chondromyces apiculatus]|uniref:FHA-domain-containing protein n=1 Tax=Chondromyces apiculatus DSM 436 TaxID=1192034 RepID=A0A017TGR5_9BACT|nr:FHA domain-containing protein [Chondromyces apiculatus]EYF08087.1 FHA-domain-containing protein [Chondromyces apiculatus DSM 436]
MITCPKCSKENQDHYKFCLGCGAELPREAAPKKFAAGTPPQGVPAARPNFGDEATAVGPGPLARAAAASAQAAASPAPAAEPMAFTPVPAASSAATGKSVPPPGDGATVVCGQCHSPNPSSNKFCALCGFKLTGKAQSIPAPAASPAAPAASPSGSIALTALRADGTEAGGHTIQGTMTVGRDSGSIFAGDSYLSPRHATFTRRGAKAFVKDESSLNGVYRKLRRDEPVLIQPGDIFRIGQEIVRLETLNPVPVTADGVERLGSPSKGYIGRIAMIIGRDTTGNAFPVPETGLHMGRERGDILFPEDGYVSGLHCQLAYQNGRLYLIDLGSSNGTFVRLYSETEIGEGDVLLMGQQLFRIAL